MQIMEIPPALEESYEFLAHETGEDRFYIDLWEGKRDEALIKELMKKRLQRFIGVGPMSNEIRLVSVRFKNDNEVSISVSY